MTKLITTIISTYTIWRILFLMFFVSMILYFISIILVGLNKPEKIIRPIFQIGGVLTIMATIGFVFYFIYLIFVIW